MNQPKTENNIAKTVTDSQIAKLYRKRYLFQDEQSAYDDSTRISARQLLLSPRFQDPWGEHRRYYLWQSDRIYIATCGFKLISEALAHKYAFRCAEIALRRCEDIYPDFRLALEIKRNWLLGDAPREALEFAHQYMEIRNNNYIKLDIEKKLAIGSVFAATIEDGFSAAYAAHFCVAVHPNLGSYDDSCDNIAAQMLADMMDEEEGGSDEDKTETR
jgi:hypothetical protein